MNEDDCFFCGADDSCIDLHEFDSPRIGENVWCCSECLTNGNSKEYNGIVIEEMNYE